VDDMIIPIHDLDKTSDGINGICFIILSWTDHPIQIPFMITYMHNPLQVYAQPI